MDVNDLMPNGFDAANLPKPEPKEQLEPMSPGCPGNCMITPAPDFYPTKKGTGYYFKVEMVVLDGSYAGRKLWDYINVSNPNPLTEQIAKVHLQKLCLACGIPLLKSKKELLGKIVRPEIVVNGIYNNVKGYNVATFAGQTTPEVASTSTSEGIKTAAEQAAEKQLVAARAVVAAADQVPFEGAADPLPIEATVVTVPIGVVNPPESINPFPQQQ